MSASSRAATGRFSRGLGDTATVLNNGMRVSGPSMVPLRIPRPAPRPQRPIPPAHASTSTTAAATPPAATSANTPGYRFRGSNVWQAYNQPGGNQNLAQLQQLAQTNPASLTPQQFALLQSAGTIPSTLPYSSAPQLATSTAAADTSAATVATSGFDLSTPYSGIPLWGWLVGVAGGLYLLTSRKGR